jgi:hypothetical protein
MSSEDVPGLPTTGNGYPFIHHPIGIVGSGGFLGFMLHLLVVVVVVVKVG